MTTYGPMFHAPWLHSTAHRVWALLAVLALAAITILVVVLNNDDTSTAQKEAPARVGTVKQDNGAAPRDCLPARVPRPC